MLEDPQVRIATMEIMPEGKSRSQIQREIKAKEAVAHSLIVYVFIWPILICWGTCLSQTSILGNPILRPFGPSNGCHRVRRVQINGKASELDVVEPKE